MLLSLYAWCYGGVVHARHSYGSCGAEFFIIGEGSLGMEFAASVVRISDEDGQRVSVEAVFSVTQNSGENGQRSSTDAVFSVALDSGALDFVAFFVLLCVACGLVDLSGARRDASLRGRTRRGASFGCELEGGSVQQILDANSRAAGIVSRSHDLVDSKRDGTCVVSRSSDNRSAGGTDVTRNCLAGCCVIPRIGVGCVSGSGCYGEMVTAMGERSRFEDRLSRRESVENCQECCLPSKVVHAKFCDARGQVVDVMNYGDDCADDIRVAPSGSCNCAAKEQLGSRAPISPSLRRGREQVAVKRHKSKRSARQVLVDQESVFGKSSGQSASNKRSGSGMIRQNRLDITSSSGVSPATQLDSVLLAPYRLGGIRATAH